MHTEHSVLVMEMERNNMKIRNSQFQHWLELWLLSNIKNAAVKMNTLLRAQILFDIHKISFSPLTLHHSS